ncbi:MAG: D-alanyl-D-alanine carboxypeptidase/D-alanyl-D-alanine-endopeptidase [Pseudomonadota bacterium]
MTMSHWSNAAELPPSVVSTLEHHKLDPAGLSVFAQEIGGDVVLSFNSDQPRNPASTMKVVTGLAALEILRPGYRWQTRFYSDAEPSNGVLNGDIYLVGGGDPYLVQERVWLMLQALKRRGVTTIAGDLVLDDSLFEPIIEDTGAFDNQPFRIYNALPSAVLTNFNSTYFVFRPSGNRVAIEAFPEMPDLSINNQLRIAQRSCGGYRRGIALSMQKANVARFDGRFPNRCRRYGFTRSVLAPETYTAGLIRSLWTQLGGELEGKTRVGTPGDEAYRLLTFDSLNAGDVTRLMNKHSSNLIARHLLLTMGGEQFGWPATEHNGRKAITEWLDRKGLVFPELIIENGAGRSRDARISARNLTRLVIAGYQSQYMPEFLASLALLGQDGTLDDRHQRTSLNGKAHLKTGRLDHVTAIAGVMQNRHGKRFALTVFHNDHNVHRGLGEAVQDSLLQWLDNYSGPAAATGSP